MIVRIAHIADSHFDESKRLEDNVAVHDAFIDQAADESVDLIVHAGDFFERKSSPAERIAMTDFLRAASRIAPVVGVKGNHDAAGDLYPYSFLGLDHNVDIQDRPSLTTASSRLAMNTGARVGVLSLPWFDKATLVAGLDATVDAGQTRELTIAAARQMLDLIRAEAGRVAAYGAIPILVGHVQVAGSETSTGQTLIGTSVELSPQDLMDVGCGYVALGHIHKYQSWFGGRVAYAGSPQRMNFGEPEEKGWILVTLDSEVPGWFVSAEFMPLPARKIVLLEAQMEDGVMRTDYIERPDVTGALVRFRYHCAPADLHLVNESEIEKMLLGYGAHDVKIEAILVHEARVRSTEIVTALTTWEKIRAFWASKNITPDEPTQVRVRAKLEELEQPAAPAPIQEVADAVA